jgi:hypothetical protein
VKNEKLFLFSATIEDKEIFFNYAKAEGHRREFSCVSSRAQKTEIRIMIDILKCFSRTLSEIVLLTVKDCFALTKRRGKITTNEIILIKKRLCWPWWNYV